MKNSRLCEANWCLAGDLFSRPSSGTPPMECTAATPCLADVLRLLPQLTAPDDALAFALVSHACKDAMQYISWISTPTSIAPRSRTWRLHNAFCLSPDFIVYSELNPLLSADLHPHAYAYHTATVSSVFRYRTSICACVRSEARLMWARHLGMPWTPRDCLVAAARLGNLVRELRLENPTLH